jgi:U3 small nucleolar RNA-associated protein 15
MHFKLPAPVESVAALPGGTTLVGSSGERLAVLDLVAGRPLGLFSNHQRTITTIATASQGSRVLSGGLDGHVKVWDTATWDVVAGIKYPSPVLSLDVVAAGPQREDRHLCVGMQSGVLSIRTRLTGAAKAAKKEKEKEMAALVAGKIDQYDAQQKKKRGRGWEKALRGMDFTGEGADIIIEGNDRRRPKLNKWENAQRRGDYQEALDLVVEQNDLAAVYGMLTEMYHRSALRKALSNRTAEQLLPILNWLNKTIGDPKFIRLKADIAMLILDIYGSQMGKSEAVDAAIDKLLVKTKAACESSQMCWTALGMLDLLKMDAVK